MFGLRILSATMSIVIWPYSIVVTLNDGWNPLPVIFDVLSTLRWTGQFGTDLTCFIFMSMVWVAWREKFSWKGIVLGTLAFLGMFFLAPYLFYLTFKSENMAALFLGKQKSDERG